MQEGIQSQEEDREILQTEVSYGRVLLSSRSSMTWEECYDRALAMVAEKADRAREAVERGDEYEVGRQHAYDDVFDRLVDLKKEVDND